MGELVTLLGQHLEQQPTTVVIQATVWKETVLACVKLQECGPEVHLPVKVCCYHMCACAEQGQDLGSVRLSV